MCERITFNPTTFMGQAGPGWSMLHIDPRCPERRPGVATEVRRSSARTEQLCPVCCPCLLAAATSEVGVVVDVLATRVRHARRDLDAGFVHGAGEDLARIAAQLAALVSVVPTVQRRIAELRLDVLRLQDRVRSVLASPVIA